jgi:hypothetical protein
MTSLERARQLSARGLSARSQGSRSLVALKIRRVSRFRRRAARGAWWNTGELGHRTTRLSRSICSRFLSLWRRRSHILESLAESQRALGDRPRPSASATARFRQRAACPMPVLAARHATRIRGRPRPVAATNYQSGNSGSLSDWQWKSLGSRRLPLGRARNRWRCGRSVFCGRRSRRRRCTDPRPSRRVVGRERGFPRQRSVAQRLRS